MFQTARAPDFSRLRKALLCQGEPDCVPLMELGIHPKFKEAILGRPCVTVHDEIRFARAAGYDYIKLQPEAGMTPGGAVAASAAGGSEQGGVRRWANEHAGAISCMEDLEKYPWPRPGEIGYARLEEAGRILPDDMAVVGQYGDIFTLAWETMGFEAFATALYEAPDLVRALYERIGGIVWPMFETMAQMPWVGALWFSDDLAYTTGLMVGAKHYREFLFPWVRRIGAVCRERGIPFVYHSDGVLWEVLEDLVDCGVTSLHPIEPRAMDIAEVKRRGGGRLAVVGNIEVDTLSRGTPQQIEEQVKDRLRRVAPGGGYAMGSSNSVPDYALLENYVAMVEACRRWGRYPISV